MQKKNDIPSKIIKKQNLWSFTSVVIINQFVTSNAYSLSASPFCEYVQQSCIQK